MRLIKQNQAGDTIVEVMIAILIVGLMLTTAYAITNRNNRSLQDTQERGQALKLVETQIELLRNSSTAFNPATSKCMNTTTNAATAAAAECVMSGSGAVTTVQPAYTISITGGDPFTVKAEWDSVLGYRNNVTIYYRP